MNPEDMAAAEAVAEAVKAAIILACMAGMDVVSPAALKFKFAPDGEITLSSMDADDAEEDSGVIPAEAIQAFLAEDKAEEAEAPEAPAANEAE